MAEGLPDIADELQPPKPPPQGRLGWVSALPGRLRQWLMAHRVKAALAAAVAMLLFSGTVVLAMALLSPKSAGAPGADLGEALEALDSGDYPLARERAEAIREADTLPPDALGGPAFVLGAAAAYEAEAMRGNEATEENLIAAGYLEEARDRGFPAGREGEGLFLLGRSLYLSGQIPAGRRILRQALKANRPKRTEIHGLLAAACMHDANPRLDEALEHNTIYLADRRITGTRRHEAELQRARILLGLGRFDPCVATLQGIPEDASSRAAALIIRAQILIHEARQVEQQDSADERVEVPQEAMAKYRAALEILEQAQGYRPEDTRQAMYLVGVCRLGMGDDYRAALEQFARVRKGHKGTPEALAASLEEAELSRRLARDADAMAGYRRVLGAITDRENFSNPFVSLEELQNRCLEAYGYYLKNNHFELSLELARLFYPLMRRTRSLELAADAHRAWGLALLEQAEQVSLGKAEPVRRRARAQLRRAGQICERLARLQITSREYPERLWSAAQNYLEGQSFTGAVRILDEYLTNVTRRRRPQALQFLGEALLSLGRYEESIEALRECIEGYPHDPVSFRARLLAGQAYLELGDPERAEETLRDNLDSDRLAPESAEWRASKFALGRVLHLAGRSEEAIRHLQEAVARYPDAPEATGAEYVMAGAYRGSAQQLRSQFREGLPDTARNVRSHRIDQLLESALPHYENVRDRLVERVQQRELDADEAAMFRNTYFAIGDTHFELGRYEDAIKAYVVASNRYQTHPEVLNAYVQMAAAYRRLGRAKEARGVLEQAKAVLKRLPADADFQLTTNFSRQQWEDRIRWMSEL